MDTIKSRARTAKVALNEALDAALSIAEPIQQDLREAQDNFLLWSVNLGVFESGHSNLDYRLQEVPEATELIKDLLEELVDNAEGLLAIATGDGTDTADDTDEYSDDDENGSIGVPDSEDDINEMQARILSLKDIMLRLFKLARSIRNYSTRSAQGQRNIYSTYPSEHRQAIINYLVDIERLRITDYVVYLRRQNHSDLAAATTPVRIEGYSTESSPDLGESEQVCDIQLDEDDQSLIARLAKASSRRRQQFVYWRHRHDRSATATELDEGKDDDQDEEPNAKLDETRMLRKVDHLSPLADRSQALSMPSSATKLRKGQINLAERASVASGISRPPSARGPGGAPVEWPSVPEGLPEGAYFNCPYCYNLCPDRYRSNIGWKSHLMHDLKPYCCTYSHCESGDQLYDSWADWTSHEMLAHNKVWTCLEHPDEEFRTPESYRDHVRHDHPDEAEHMQTPEIVAARATGSKWPGRDCPFCLASYQYAGELHRHIAWHLESIALGALPRSTGFEQGSQEGVDRDSAAQDFGDVDSRASQFSGLSLPDNEDRSPAAAFACDQEEPQALGGAPLEREESPEKLDEHYSLTSESSAGSFAELSIGRRVQTSDGGVAHHYEEPVREHLTQNPTPFATTDEMITLIFRPIRKSLEKIATTTKSAIPDDQRRASELHGLLTKIGDFIAGQLYDLEENPPESIEKRYWDYAATYWPDTGIDGSELQMIYNTIVASERTVAGEALIDSDAEKLERLTGKIRESTVRFDERGPFDRRASEAAKPDTGGPSSSNKVWQPWNRTPRGRMYRLAYFEGKTALIQFDGSSGPYYDGNHKPVERRKAEAVVAKLEELMSGPEQSRVRDNIGEQQSRDRHNVGDASPTALRRGLLLRKVGKGDSKDDDDVNQAQSPSRRIMSKGTGETASEVDVSDTDSSISGTFGARAPDNEASVIPNPKSQYDRVARFNNREVTEDELKAQLETVQRTQGALRGRYPLLDTKATRNSDELDAANVEGEAKKRESTLNDRQQRLLHDTAMYYRAYNEANDATRSKRSASTYPQGYVLGSDDDADVTRLMKQREYLGQRYETSLQQQQSDKTMIRQAGAAMIGDTQVEDRQVHQSFGGVEQNKRQPEKEGTGSFLNSAIRTLKGVVRREPK